MPENLTISELCQRWGVHRATLAIWRMREEGPPYFKVGRKVFYPVQCVEAYERRHLKNGDQNGSPQ